MLYFNGDPCRWWQVWWWFGRWWLALPWRLRRITPDDAAKILNLTRKGVRVDVRMP